MRIPNLRVFSTARKTLQQNAYLKIFTLPSQGNKFHDVRVTKKSISMISNDNLTQSARMLKKRIR